MLAAAFCWLAGMLGRVHDHVTHQYSASETDMRYAKIFKMSLEMLTFKCMFESQSVGKLPVLKLPKYCCSGVHFLLLG